MRAVMPFSRADTSVLGRWWWTVDRWVLAAVLVLVLFGAILTLTASPPAAERMGLEPFHFVRQQFAFLPMALCMVAGAVVSERVARAAGAARLVGAAMLLMAAGIASVSLLGDDTGYWQLMPSFVVIGIGGGLIFPDRFPGSADTGIVQPIDPDDGEYGQGQSDIV